MRIHFRKLTIAFIAVLLFALNASAKDSGGNASKKIDIDLTRMSSTMVYAYVFKMVNEPTKFIGKRIRMKGVFSSYYDQETQKRYYGCVIEGGKITIIGDFEMAEEGNDAYPVIRNAKMSNE